MKTFKYLALIIVISSMCSAILAQTEFTKKSLIVNKKFLQRTESEILSDAKKYEIIDKIFYKDGHILDVYAWLLLTSKQDYNEKMEILSKNVKFDNFFADIKKAKNVNEVIRLIDNNQPVREAFFERGNPKEYTKIRKQALNGELVVVIIDNKPFFYEKEDVKNPDLKKKIQKVLPLN
jgi:hypothetical protein